MDMSVVKNRSNRKSNVSSNGLSDKRKAPNSGLVTKFNLNGGNKILKKMEDSSDPRLAVTE